MCVHSDTHGEQQRARMQLMMATLLLLLLLLMPMNMSKDCIITASAAATSSFTRKSRHDANNADIKFCSRYKGEEVQINEVLTINTAACDHHHTSASAILTDAASITRHTPKAPAAQPAMLPDMQSSASRR
jgi:hypothetical protein